MTHARLAAWLFGAYAMLLVANAVFYGSWSGDTSEVPRLLMRVAGIGLIAFGLWRRVGWVWWVGVVVGTVLGLLGLASVGLAALSGLFAERPYPVIDYAVFLASSTVLLGAVFTLLLPSGRAAFRKAA